MTGLRGRFSPELFILQTIGPGVLTCAGAGTKYFALDLVNRMEKPIAIFDLQGYCVFHNESFKALGQKGDTVALAQLDLAGRELNRMLDQGVPLQEFRDELIVGGGRRVPLLLDVYPLPGAHGRRIGFVISAIDQTRELRARICREQMSVLLDSVLGGVLGLGPNGEIILCNRLARNLLVLGDASLECEPVEGIMVNSKDPEKNLFAALLEEGGPGSREVTLPWADGLRRFRIESVSCSNAAGRIIFFRDGKTQKDSGMEDSATQALSDIRSPLATIRSFVQVFGQKAREAGFEDGRSYADIITEQLDRAGDIIANFNPLSKPGFTAGETIVCNKTAGLGREWSRSRSFSLQRDHRAQLPPLRKGLRQKIAKIDQMANELNVARRVLGDLFEALPLGFLEIDSRGRIMDANPRTATLLGLGREKILQLHYLEVIHPLDRSTAEQWLNDHGTHPIEVRLTDECWVSARSIPSSIPTFKTIIWEDVSEKKRCEVLQLLNKELVALHDRLRFLSTRDTMTGLFNRQYFEEEIRRLQNPRFAPVSIIIADMDGLKQINDHFGHQMGDQLISDAAKVLKRPFRETDMVARIGGDEFAVVLPHTPPELARVRREEILREVDRYNLTWNGPNLSLSIGIATSVKDGAPLEAIIKQADDDMYRSKRVLRRQCFEESLEY